MLTRILTVLFIRAYVSPETYAKTQCRADYMRSNTTGKCVGCPLGYFGRNCIYKCRYPKFGRRCLEGVCNCSREFCKVSTGCMSVQVKNSTILTTPENIFHLRSDSNDEGSTIRENSDGPLTILAEEKRIKFKQKNFDHMKSEDIVHRKSGNNRHINFVSAILVTIIGTSVTVLLIVAIVHQIKSKMCRKVAVKQRQLFITPEPGGIYNEINNVLNN